MPETITLSAPKRLDEDTSRRMRFFAFLSMVLLVFVHGYNLQQRYLQPVTFLINEPQSFTTFFEYLTANGLFRFRIPMLFAISGYFYAMSDYRPYGDRSLKRLRTLGLPYLLWSAMGLLVTYLWELSPLLAGSATSAMLKGDTLPVADYPPGRLLMTWVMDPIPFQLWFIRTLLILNLLYPLLAKAVMKGPKIYFPIIALLWLSHMEIYWIGGESLLFFSLGIWLQKRQYDLDRVPFGWPIWLWVALWIGSSVIKTVLAYVPHDVFNPDWSIKPEHQLEVNIKMPVMLLLYKLTVITGLVAVWFGGRHLASRAMKAPAIAWASGFAFVIYGLHEPLLHYATNLAFEHLSHVPNYRLLIYLLLPAAIVLFCIGFGAALRAAWPKGYAVLTGGRGLG